MAEQTPGGDELRVRAMLWQQQGVGAAAIGPKPTARPRDWLDDILNTPATPAAKEPEVEAPVEKKPPARPAAPKKRRKRKKRHQPGRARTAWDTLPPSPRQSLMEAYDRVPYRLKWLAYHAAAAYLGWSMGLVGWSTYVTGWIDETGLIGTQAFFWYGAATCTFLLYRRTRNWWRPVAWLAAVPATSTVVGVLLYAPHP